MLVFSSELDSVLGRVWGPTVVYVQRFEKGKRVEEEGDKESMGCSEGLVWWSVMVKDLDRCLELRK